MIHKIRSKKTIILYISLLLIALLLVAIVVHFPSQPSSESAPIEPDIVQQVQDKPAVNKPDKDTLPLRAHMPCRRPAVTYLVIYAMISLALIVIIKTMYSYFMDKVKGVNNYTEKMEEISKLHDRSFEQLERMLRDGKSDPGYNDYVKPIKDSKTGLYALPLEGDCYNALINIRSKMDENQKKFNEQHKDFLPKLCTGFCRENHEELIPTDIIGVIVEKMKTLPYLLPSRWKIDIFLITTIVKSGFNGNVVRKGDQTKITWIYRQEKEVNNYTEKIEEISKLHDRSFRQLEMMLSNGSYHPLDNDAVAPIRDSKTGHPVDSIKVNCYNAVINIRNKMEENEKKFNEQHKDFLPKLCTGFCRKNHEEPIPTDIIGVIVKEMKDSHYLLLSRCAIFIYPITTIVKSGFNGNVVRKGDQTKITWIYRVSRYY